MDLISARYRIGDFTDGGFGARGIDGQRQQIAVTFAGAAGQRRQRFVDVLLIALFPQAGQLVDLQPAYGGVLHLQHVDRRFVCWLELVDTDHRLVAGVDPGLGLGGGFLDSQLRNAGLDRLGHAAERLNLLDMAPGLGGEIAGEPLDVV
jgi:hypothetical protein